MLQLGLVLALLLRNGSASNPVIGFLIMTCPMLFVVRGFGLLLQLLQQTSAAAFTLTCQGQGGKRCMLSTFIINPSPFNKLKKSTRPVPHVVFASVTSSLCSCNRNDHVSLSIPLTEASWSFESPNPPFRIALVFWSPDLICFQKDSSILIVYTGCNLWAEVTGS